MKPIVKNYFTLFIFLMFCGSIYAQNSVSGKVQDEQGQPLPGASVLIKGTNQGVASDFDGNFTLNSDTEFPWTLMISYTGFRGKKVVINQSTTTFSVNLEEDFASLDEVVITAGRKAEKAIDAVASVSVISAREVAAQPVSADVNNLLRNTVGVKLVQNGAGDTNVELRGSAVVNTSNTLVLKDYQPLTSIGNKRVNSAAIPLTPIDIAKVEVVRGPSGALYGPNVTSGVVHYLTKDPFKYTGLDVYTGLGNQNQSQIAVRYANHSKNDKFGYKLLFKRNQMDEFDITGEGLTRTDGTTPILQDNSVFTLVDGSTIDVGNNLIKDTYSTSYEATLVYKFNENTSLTYVGSINDYRQNYRNQTAHLYNGERNFLNQLRFNSGRFFATAFIEKNFGNTSLPNKVFSFNYGNGNQTAQPISDNFYYDITAQYSLDLGEKTSAVVGGDAKIIPAFEDTRIFGVNSNNNAFSIYGGYVSIKHDFNDKLSFNLAGRYDQYNEYDQGAFSPRIGFVYKPNEVTAIRLSANRSFSAESQVRFHLDSRLPIPTTLPSTNAIGVGTAVTYDNPVTRFAFGQVQGGDSYQLADIIAALAAKAGVTVDGSGVSGVVNPSLTTAIFGAPQIGRPGGPLTSLGLAGSGGPELQTVNSLELGYSTIIAKKLKIQLDAYYSVTQNILPQGVIPLSAGAQLNVNAVGAQIQTALEGSVDQATIDQLITILGTSAPGPPRAGYGLIVSDIAQERGHLFDVGFPTYGKNDVKYWGLDLGLNYFVNDDWSLIGNFSYVNQNIWTPEDLGETNPNYEYFLNTPKTRFTLGVNYLPASKFYGTLNINSQAEFEGKQGDGRIFTGVNPARTIANMSLGYRIEMKGDNKLDIGISANNLFDTKYEQFVNLPTIRRTVLATVKYHL
jgi:outer membrane receptor for ferrienterochelin and colicins